MRMRRLVSVLLLLGLVLVMFKGLANASETPDPSGVNTGNASDLGLKDPAAPTLQEVADAVGHTKVSINFTWVLICGFLVMFMQAGFALVEVGFTRAKNAAHTMTMNVMVYAIGMLAFWACGFALQMGGVGALGTLGGDAMLNKEFTVNIAGHAFGLFGMKGFFLSGQSLSVGIMAMFLFQMVFMDTTVTIPTGALAERWKFKSFILLSIAIGALIYPIFANWVWGGGWISQLGKNFGLGHGGVDFAGSSVVHLCGGVIAFVCCRSLGARIGKYNKDGSVNAIPGHHIPMALLGTVILAFGWFGFNAGSTLAGTDLRMSVVAVNTMLASAAGAATGMGYYWWRYGKPDPSMMANGMLAGLVAITAPCGFVSAPGAVIIGAIAGVLVVVSCLFVEKKLKIDDPVGAISVHGVNGAFGVIAVGLFADGTYGDGWNGAPGTVRGLFYGGGASQLYAQLITIAANLVWVGLATAACWFVIGKLVKGHRVSKEVELEGLDMDEMGVKGYPEFQLGSSGGGHAAAEEVEAEPVSAPVTARAAEPAT